MPNCECGFSDVPGGASGRDMLVFYGPTIIVDIGFDSTFNPTGGIIQIPTPGVTGIRALVDTGATESFIDSLLAAQLNLPIVDRRKISGAHGADDVNMHLAQVRIPGLNFVLHGAFGGVHLQAGGQPHSAIIGRTMLQRCKMIYDGVTGKVMIERP